MQDGEMMRVSGLILAIGALAATPALAATYLGAPLTPPELQAKIVDEVASRLANAPEIAIRDLKLSQARSGSGYCGLVSADGKAPFQPFHALIDPDGSMAVLILPERGDPPGLPRADAEKLLANLGCAP